jgi:hypothetical protein
MVVLQRGLQKNSQELENKDQELMEAHLALKAQVRLHPASMAPGDQFLLLPSVASFRHQPSTLGASPSFSPAR